MKNKGYRDMLNKQQVPADIHKMIEETCEGLPQKQYKRSYKGAVKAVLTTGISLAAAFAMVVGINAVNPVFAESLPLIGGIFKEYNSDKKASVGTFAGTYEGVEEVKDMALKSGTMSLTMTEVYSDGFYIHAGFKLEYPEMKGQDCYYLSPYMTATADGQELSSEGSGVALYPKGDIFEGTGSWKLPTPAADGQEINFAFTVSKLINVYNNGADYKDIAAEFKGEHKLTAHTGDNKSYDSFNGSGDIKIEKIESTPSFTKIKFNTPFWGSDAWKFLNNTTLTLEDGTLLQHTLGNDGSNKTHFAPNSEKIEYDMFFDGVPKGTEKVILRIGENYVMKENTLESSGKIDGIKILGEVTINLADGSFEPTTTYEAAGYEKYDDYLEDYLSLDWHLGFDKMRFEDGPSQATMEEVFADDSNFNNDFGVFSVNILKDNTIDLQLLKRGDYKDVTFTVENGGKEILSIKATNNIFFNNDTAAAYGTNDIEVIKKKIIENETMSTFGTTDPEAIKKIKEEAEAENLAIALDEDRINEQVSYDEEALTKIIDGNNYYTIGAKLTEAVRYLDTITIKAKDTATGKEIFSQDIKFSRKDTW